MEWVKNERGVSPVIGVILMVAITVVLAAVIASFVFGMGSKVQAPPQVQLVLKDNATKLTDGDSYEAVFDIEHSGGDDLIANDIVIYVYYANETLLDELIYNSASNYFNGTEHMLQTNHTTVLNDHAFSPGEKLTIYEYGNNTARGVYIVKVFHKPSSTFIFSGDVRVK